MPTAPKKGSGHKWSLTANRKMLIIDMLKKQYTLSSIAAEFGVSQETISKALKKDKINWKAIRMSSLNRLRAEVYESIYKIDDDSKRVKAGLEFLDRYPIQEDEDEDEDNGSSKGDVIKDAANKILEELK